MDADPPTAEVVVPDPPYQANWPAQVLVVAGDATSVWRTCRCASGRTCTPGAPLRQQGRRIGLVPHLQPNRPGRLQPHARATDRVGHTATSAAKPVYVDDSAPTVSLAAPANGSWYPATEYPGKSNTWAVHFSGAVSDPALSGSVDGSGVPADGVWVTLYRADGGLVGAGPQTAMVTGGAWALDYLFGDADPSGCYRAVVEAVDQVARTSGLPDAQVARHTAAVEQPITVDADPTYAIMDWTNLPAGQLGPAATVLGGAASARPVPVVLKFTGGSNSAQTDLVLTCRHGNEGGWWQPYSTVGAALATGQTTPGGRTASPRSTGAAPARCSSRPRRQRRPQRQRHGVRRGGAGLERGLQHARPDRSPSRRTRRRAAAATAARRAHEGHGGRAGGRRRLPAGRARLAVP